MWRFSLHLLKHLACLTNHHNQIIVPHPEKNHYLQISQQSQLGLHHLAPLKVKTVVMWLTEYKVVWSEDLAKWSRPYGVHCARFQVHKHSTGDILPTCKCIMNKSELKKQWTHLFQRKNTIFKYFCANMESSLKNPEDSVPYRWLHYSRHWSCPAGDHCRHGNCQLGQYHAHHWSLPRTTHGKTQREIIGGCWGGVG